MAALADCGSLTSLTLAGVTKLSNAVAVLAALRHLHTLDLSVRQLITSLSTYDLSVRPCLLELDNSLKLRHPLSAVHLTWSTHCHTWPGRPGLQGYLAHKKQPPPKTLQ